MKCDYPEQRGRRKNTKVGYKNPKTKEILPYFRVLEVLFMNGSLVSCYHSLPPLLFSIRQVSRWQQRAAYQVMQGWNLNQYG